MKSTFSILLILVVQSTTFGQQESQYINVSNNPFLVNPAAGGMTDIVHLEATSRFQWTGYNGGPRTVSFVGNGQVRFGKKSKVLSEYNVDDKAFFSSPKNTPGKYKHVVGGKASNDAIGPFSRSSVHASYSIHLPFTKRLNFGAGIGLGWSNFKINQSRVILDQDDDLSYSQFLGNTSSQNYLDANAGIIFYGESFVGGFSMSQLLKNKVQFSDVETESNHNRHFYFHVKYKIPTKGLLTFEPAAVVKIAEQSPISIDLGGRFIFDNKAWLGVQYRTSNALVLQIGSNLIKNLYIAYGYELATGRIKTASNGTHEIQLGFYIGNNRNIDKEIKENTKEGEAE